MARLLIRVDGSTEIGLGHFVRCVALGQIGAQSFDVTFVFKMLPDACLQELGKNRFKFFKILKDQDLYQHIKASDVVVLDGYHFTEDTEKRIKKTGCKLITVDDLFNRHFVGDCVINHGMGIHDKDYSKAPYTKIYHGTDYLLVRSNFYDAACKIRKINTVKNLYVNMGGSDPLNISSSILKQLDTSKFENIHIVLGAASNNLSEIRSLIEKNTLKNVSLHYNLDQYMMQKVMEKCHLAICTPSGIAYELCCVSIGMIVCKTSANQKYFFREFVNRGLALGIDTSDNNYIEKILQSCDSLGSNIDMVADQLVVQRTYFNVNAQENIHRILKD